MYFFAATTDLFEFNPKTIAERMNPFLGKVLQSLKKNWLWTIKDGYLSFKDYRNTGIDVISAAR